MAVSHTLVQIRVEEGVLWVADEAYPLRNISHVGQRKLEVNKKKAQRQFIRRTIGCVVFLGILAATDATVGGLFLFLLLEGLAVWRLVRVTNKPSLYGLVLNTSGTQREAVWSTDAGEIHHLIAEITKAIGHPDVAQVIYNVQNAVSGDFIQQYGDGNIGTAQHSGSGAIGTR